MPNWNLIFSVIHFLKEESKKSAHNPDTQESLEVAVQCLQTAYDIDPSDPRLSKNPAPAPLEKIFADHASNKETDNEEAERLKNLGNDMMKADKPKEAIQHYTEAILLDDRKAVYYCNRAAAFSKLGDYASAIVDCHRAVDLDPYYAKAHGRLGLAFLAMGKNNLARDAFRKAVELDPTSESYASNLAQLERESGEQAGGFLGGGAPDFGRILRNPDFMKMASDLMSNPVIAETLAGAAQGQAPGGGGGGGNAQGGDFSRVMDATREVVSQIRDSNPELLAQFQNIFQQGQNPGAAKPEDEKKEPPAS